MTKPNIIYIFADDMGYGDLGANNPASKIPTPNLDRMAAEGMRFIDTHAGSSVCTPSRYNVLTGRYAWRSRLKTGIVWQWDAPLIEPGRRTVAQLLRDEGYRTACLGKWHLGWDWRLNDGSHANDHVPFGHMDDVARTAIEARVDFTSRIDGGPVDRGFDTYFGIDVPNFPPYTWFENDRITELPTVDKPENMYGHAGTAVEGWSLEAMIPAFTRRAVDLIESRADNSDPFFLYFPLTSPHSPIVPNKPFQGMSGAGPYGDFVCEVDGVVGEVLNALDRSGTAENTLVIFTSDNGPENRTADDIGAYERARTLQHYSMGHLRGIKREAWEGGHRVPFVARWPAVTPAGTVCDQLTTLGDLMATCADITGTELESDEGEDSVSILPLLKGAVHRPVRDHAVHHSCSGRFAVRKGQWVFIDAPTGDENNEPDWFKEERGYTPHELAGELYDLNDDISERVNRYADHPDIVAEMLAVLAEEQGDETAARPAPRPDQELSE